MQVMDRIMPFGARPAAADVLSGRSDQEEFNGVSRACETAAPPWAFRTTARRVLARADGRRRQDRWHRTYRTQKKPPTEGRALIFTTTPASSRLHDVKWFADNRHWLEVHNCRTRGLNLPTALATQSGVSAGAKCSSFAGFVVVNQAEEGTDDDDKPISGTRPARRARLLFEFLESVNDRTIATSAPSI
jgi:hypothetical protein